MTNLQTRIYLDELEAVLLVAEWCNCSTPGKSGLATTSLPGLTWGGGGRAASNGLKNRCSYVSLEGFGYAKSPPMTITYAL